MRNIKLIIEYNGTNYQGWQRQKNTTKTLQQEIEATLAKILQKGIRLIGSGRTDAGVHAAAQVANFKTNTKIPLKNIQKALNSLLADDIVVTNIKEADSKFHSRYDAKSKTYRYTILNRKYPSAFWKESSVHIPYKLDYRAMQKRDGQI